MRDWLTILLFTNEYLLLFVVAEMLYKRNYLRADHTRNLVHAGSGLIALFFPIFFDDVWPVAILCAGFLLLLLMTKQLNLFGAVNAVKRKTYGSLLYPVSVFILFYNYVDAGEYHRFVQWPFSSDVNYYLPLSILAFADPAAALAGRYFNKNQSAVKCFHGSIAFAIVAFILSIGLLTWFNNYESAIGIAGMSLLVTAGTTVAEYWSKKGLDNITVPLIALIILEFSFEILNFSYELGL